MEEGRGEWRVESEEEWRLRVERRVKGDLNATNRQCEIERGRKKKKKCEPKNKVIAKSGS